MIFGLLKKTILCSGKYRDRCLKALFLVASGVSKGEGRISVPIDLFDSKDVTQLSAITRGT